MGNRWALFQTYEIAELFRITNWDPNEPAKHEDDNVDTRSETVKALNRSLGQALEERGA